MGFVVIQIPLYWYCSTVPNVEEKDMFDAWRKQNTIIGIDVIIVTRGLGEDA